MTSGQDLTPRVRALLANVTDLEVVSEDADLLQSGRMDSLALVELIFAIEEEFGIELQLEQLDAEQFRTIGAIAELVSGARENENGMKSRATAGEHALDR